MKLIKPSFEIIEQQSGLDGMFKQIELAGRTCYHSEDKITETSAKEFVNRMIKSGHGAMLEHGTVYLAIPVDDCEDLPNGWVHKLFDYSSGTYGDGNTIKSPWIKVKYIRPKFIITTNYRWIIENGATFMLKYLCEPTEFHEKRICVRFICDRGVSHEFVRHRVFSFAQESTRYCNYAKDKFNNELTYILPSWMDEKQLGQHNPMTIIKEVEGFSECMALNNQEIAEVYFMENLARAELNYNKLISLGWKAEQARNILPFCIKAPLIMTGFISDWKHFFNLRTPMSAHPQARELAIPLCEEFIKRGWLK